MRCMVIVLAGILNGQAALAFNCGGAGNSGKPGQTGTAEGCARAGCHTVADAFIPIIEIQNRPTTAISGELHLMNVVVRESNGLSQNAGYDLAASAGLLGTDDITSRITSTTQFHCGTRLDAYDGELTHEVAKTASTVNGERVATWPVLWRAPVVALTQNAKLYARGLAGDGNFVVSNDSTTCVTNPCSNGLDVTVKPHPLLDTSFGPGALTTVNFNNGAEADTGRALALQPDGKIVVVGASNQGGVGLDFGVARLNADGSADTGFGAGGTRIFGFNLGNDNFDNPKAVALQADGKIVVAGTVVTADVTDYDFAVARLTTTGALDSAGFGTAGKVTVPINLGGPAFDDLAAVAVQKDGKIVLAGTADRVGEPSNRDFVAVRLNPNGSLDGSFGAGGKAVMAFDAGDAKTDVLYAMALQKDGKIVVGGTVNIGTGGFDEDRFALARLNPANGTLDASFGTGGKVVLPFPGSNLRALAVQADGKVVIAGFLQDLNGAQFRAARVNTDGSVDTSFGVDGLQTPVISPGGMFIDFANAIAVQPNGKIIMAGIAYHFFPFFDFGVVRLNADGSLDASFGPGGKTTLTFGGNNDYEEISAVAIQPDGKIVFVGSAEMSPGATQTNSEVVVGRLLSPGPNQSGVFSNGFE